MYISSRVHLQESWYRVAVYIYYHVFICRKVHIKLRYPYIITCSSAGKLIKVGACLYYHVFICINVDIKLRSVYTYLYVFIDGKVDIKLRYVYIITCSSAGKLI